jgi:hypothetical protein
MTVRDMDRGEGMTGGTVPMRPGAAGTDENSVEPTIREAAADTYEVLRFRRQFLMAVAPISPPPGWHCARVGRFWLYSHPELHVSHIEEHGRAIALIGDAYDAAHPEKENDDVLADVLAQSGDHRTFLVWTRRYTGTWAFMLASEHGSILVHDARALREVYYCQTGNGIVCGSQPHLIAQYSSPEIPRSVDSELVEFFSREMWDSRWVGDGTVFEGVKHLLPNHYLNLDNRRPCRHWPDRYVERLRLEDAVPRLCVYLQGVMRAIVRRRPCMMAITAGTDSRTLLAASKDLTSHIYCFVNDNGLGSDNPDITIPRRMCERLGLPFHVHDVPADVDPDFRMRYLANTFLASERLLPSIYNVFYRQHQEKLLILGVSEIGRTFYGWEPRDADSYRMSYKLGYPNSRYALQQCEQARSELQDAARRYGVGVLALLYWEQRLGNWGGTRNSESALAIEKVDPYNSHFVYELFQGVDPKYRSYRHNPCALFREMIRMMWPELLNWPVNPAASPRDRLMGALDRIWLFELGKELKYQLTRARYRRRLRL